MTKREKEKKRKEEDKMRKKISRSISGRESNCTSNDSTLPNRLNMFWKARGQSEICKRIKELKSLKRKKNENDLNHLINIFRIERNTCLKYPCYSCKRLRLPLSVGIINEKKEIAIRKLLLQTFNYKVEKGSLIDQFICNTCSMAIRQTKFV